MLELNFDYWSIRYCFWDALIDPDQPGFYSLWAVEFHCQLYMSKVDHPISQFSFALKGIWKMIHMLDLALHLLWIMKFIFHFPHILFAWCPKREKSWGEILHWTYIAYISTRICFRWWLQHTFVLLLILIVIYSYTFVGYCVEGNYIYSNSTILTLLNISDSSSFKRGRVLAQCFLGANIYVVMITKALD